MNHTIVIDNKVKYTYSQDHQNRDGLSWYLTAPKCIYGENWLHLWHTQLTVTLMFRGRSVPTSKFDASLPINPTFAHIMDMYIKSGRMGHFRSNFKFDGKFSTEISTNSNSYKVIFILLFCTKHNVLMARNSTRTQQRKVVSEIVPWIHDIRREAERHYLQ